MENTELFYKLAADIVERVQVETHFPINHHTRGALIVLVQAIIVETLHSEGFVRLQPILRPSPQEPTK